MPGPPPIPADNPELWFVDDVPLNTLGYNISSWGDTRQQPPGLRGTDYVVPFRPGAIPVPKTMDAGLLTLGMWVQGSDPTTGAIPTMVVTLAGTPPWYLAGPQKVSMAEKQFRTNWRTLRRLLFTPNRQFVLKKIFYDDVTDSNITANTKAQYSSGLAPQINGLNHAAFTVDLNLPDRRFYSVDSLSATSSTTVGGDVFTNNAQISIPASATLVNTTTGRSLHNTGTGAITLDCATGVSTGNVGKMIVSGPPGPWFWLEVGVNTLSLGGSTVTYNRAWL